MLEADGRAREALAAIERAAALQDQLAAADPGSARARGETATNYAMRGRLLATLGRRAAAFADLDRAVAITRTLSQGNPDNIEMRVSVALALIGRADAALALAKARAAEPDDRERSRRDLSEAVELLTALEREGAIEGTDLSTLEDARRKLRDAGGPP